MTTGSLSTPTIARHFGAAASPLADGPDFAQRLGLWLHAFDAIGLQAALQVARGGAAAAPATPADRQRRPPNSRTLARTLAQDLDRTQGTLTHAIRQEAAQLSPQDDPPESWMLRHKNLQRRMEQAILPLRSHVRQSLAGVSERLRALAALDAALERALALREQTVLAKAPALLRMRLHELPREAWPDAWQRAMAAELALRLEPVHGLVDALREEEPPTSP